MQALSRKAALWLAGALVLTSGIAFGAPGVGSTPESTPVTAEASPTPEATAEPTPSASPEATETPEATEGPDEQGDINNEEEGDHQNERSTEGCPDGFEGNHGQFVSSSDDQQEAAHSDCGKPVKSDKNDKKNADKASKSGKDSKSNKSEQNNDQNDE